MATKGLSAVRTVLLAIREAEGESAGDDDEVVVQSKPVTTTPKEDGKPKEVATPVTQGDSPPQTPVQPQPRAKGPPPVIPAIADQYPTKRDDAQKLLTALLAHRQKAHVTTETGAATTALQQAKTHADAKEWMLALQQVENARKACVDGKGFADRYHTYVTGPRRAANDAIAAATAVGIDVGAHQTKLTGADTKARPPTRDYTGATTDVEQIGTDIGASLITKYIVPREQKVQAHKTSAVKDFLKPLTDKIDAALVQARQFVTSKAYAQVLPAAISISAMLTSADKMGPRRKAFEDQRPLTVTELDKVNAIPALALPYAALNARLTTADHQASFAAQHMDDAERELKALAQDALALLDLHAKALLYTTERQACDTAMQALDQHKAAAQIVAERNAATLLLAAAVTAAGDSGAAGAALVIQADPKTHDLPKAIAMLAQLKADQALAQQVADGLAGVADAKAAVATTQDASSFNTALQALKTDLAKARSEDNAKLGKKPYEQAEKAISNCEGHVKKSAFTKAQAEFDTACTKLAEGRRLQVEHAQYEQQHDALATRLKQLKKTDQASGIKPALEALDQALDKAKKQDKSADFVQALALLKEAEAAAAKADAARAWREEFDKREASLKQTAERPEHRDAKKARLADLKAAAKHADGLHFDAATKALDAIDSALANADVQRLAAANPNDPNLLKRAQDLKKAGGTKALDDLIATLPTNVSKDVFSTLAKERFGVDVLSTDGESADTSAALKQMCKLFATIPDVVMDNPSLAKVQHTGSGGASYNAANSLVKMNSRPAPNSKADFKKDAHGNLPTTRLPADREEACLPANDKPEDLFDFNSIHEIAHAIDDSNNFMNSRLGANNTEFAGWVVHGGDLKPIADAVAAKHGYDLNDEQKRYVLDKIVGNPIVVPLDDTGAEPGAWKTARDKIDAWHAKATTDGIWSDQAGSMAIDINGRIYQQSYANKWTSYQTAARKRGITGYQFRAPGEWFSELFAAYKLGKLKKGHPSEGWLSTLSV